MNKIKSLLAFSGGKDSVASLITVLNDGWKPEVIFCDTGWEHPLTYQYLNYIEKALGIKITWLKSDKYEGFIDLIIKKKRFPSPMSRFCTEILKVKPTVDHILDNVAYHFTLFQGIRADESKKRSTMNKHCTYFKYFFEPYGYDKSGKPKYHTYRKDKVFELYQSQYSHDIIRPVFDKTAEEVFDIHKKAGIEPNPLYKMNHGRVGCYPCIMVTHAELWNIYIRDPKRIEELCEYEELSGSTFFSPDYIPKRYLSKEVDVWKEVGNYSEEEIDYLINTMGFEVKETKKGDKIHIKMKVCTMRDVIRYLEDKNSQGTLFQEDNKRLITSCDSIYTICE